MPTYSAPSIIPTSFGYLDSRNDYSIRVFCLSVCSIRVFEQGSVYKPAIKKFKIQKELGINIMHML